jgi:hypothetical protein
MRPRKRRERAASAASLRCSECGSQKINCERAGADVCELAADLLRCTGRPIEDEPDDEGIWH